MRDYARAVGPSQRPREGASHAGGAGYHESDHRYGGRHKTAQCPEREKSEAGAANDEVDMLL